MRISSKFFADKAKIAGILRMARIFHAVCNKICRKDVGQHRTKIVRQMRRQIFRQMKQKAE